MSVAAPIVINNGAFRDAGRVHDPDADDFDGVVPIDTYATEWQISVRKGDATTGLVALTGVSLGSDEEEVIYDEAGDAVVFDLSAATKTYRISGAWEQFVLTPDNTVDGTYISETAGWLA